MPRSMTQKVVFGLLPSPSRTAADLITHPDLLPEHSIEYRFPAFPLLLSTSSRYDMGRECVDCGVLRWKHSFSRSQWTKGPGDSRCRDCMNGTPVHQNSIVCPETVSKENGLHTVNKSHQPDKAPPPMYREVRFKSGPTAAQHAKEGICSGCHDHKLALRLNAYVPSVLQPFLNETRMINGAYKYTDMCESPFKCNRCFRWRLIRPQEQKDQLVVVIGN